MPCPTCGFEIDLCQRVGCRQGPSLDVRRPVVPALVVLALGLGLLLAAACVGWVVVG